MQILNATCTKKKKALTPSHNKRQTLCELPAYTKMTLSNCDSLFSSFTNTGRADKLDNSFSRSRSSSMSSLENITSEAVTCLAFVDSYTKKSGKVATNLSF